jgi:serine/threonine protein kinase
MTLKRRSPRRYGFDTLLREIARAGEVEPEREPRPPRRLGRYLVGDLVGRGGMGAVYRARDLELDREVAIKLVHGKRDSIRLVRFAREVRALALLSHPNVVAIHDAAVHRGTAYLVMELVEGLNLRQMLLRDLRLPVQRALQLARQIADGLAAAHARGIVHRDLKPENVIVMTHGHLKVLDFGLAQLSEPGSGAAPRHATLTGAVLGTPHYMSPEQVRGRRVTARSDVFSFGALLYEMLFGRKAFAATTAAESYTRILNAQPDGLARPSATTARGRLLSIAKRCLHKDPLERFPSGLELAVALADAEHKKRSAAAGRSSAAPTESIKLPNRRRLTRYATDGDVHIAYQVIGNGPVDLCFVSGFVSNLDVWWEQARGRAFFGGLAAHTRLIMFDKRGTGLSDRVPTQTLDQRVADLRAVLDAAGSKRTVIFGDAGATCIRFAARFPERTHGLILYGTTAQSWAAGPHVRDLLMSRWGTGVSLPIFAPSLCGDPSMVRWAARWERSSASPGALASLLDAVDQLDVTAEARTLQTPTLVIHRKGDKTIPAASGRTLAALIPGARYSEHEGDDHALMIGDAERIVTEVLAFVGELSDSTERATRSSAPVDRR